MEIIGPLLVASLAGLSTTFGSIPIFLNIKKKEEFITFALAFSLSVMITLSIIDLIPTSFFKIVGELGFKKSILVCLLLFIISIVLVNTINKYINREKNNKNSLYKLGILNMITLILHNIPEGIATFIASYSDLSIGIKLGIAIMIHNIPEGIAIAVPLYYATGKRRVGVIYTFISGLSEPIGGLLAYILLSQFISEIFISYILIIVAGIMITLAINEILPEAIKYNKRIYLMLGLILGFTMILISSLF